MAYHRSILPVVPAWRREAAENELKRGCADEVPLTWLVGHDPDTMGYWWSTISRSISACGGLIAVGMSFVLSLWPTFHRRDRHHARRRHGQSHAAFVRGHLSACGVECAVSLHNSAAGTAANSGFERDLHRPVRLSLGANPRRQFLACSLAFF
jgi:hypothetical protein